MVAILVWDSGSQFPRAGSGLVINLEGVLLTAYHLVRGAERVEVRFTNGEIYDQVDLLGVDERRDIVALRIAASGLPVLPVATIEEVSPGETLYLVSNPEGTAWTASSGVLSAVRRADEIAGAGTGFRLLQVTAPASPESSGGTVLDTQGRALGIVIGSRRGQDLHFAVPIETVVGLAESSDGISLGTLGEESHEAPEVGPSVPPTAEPEEADPFELLRSARTIYIFSKTPKALGFPVEPLEKKLLEEPEFQSREFVLVNARPRADLVVELDRKFMTWDFTFRITHPATGIIVGSGKVIAWDGTRAASGTAKQIMQHLRTLHRPAVSNPTNP
ncbi:MAG: S1C family serine protease [Terriglobia bacterium]